MKFNSTWKRAVLALLIGLVLPFSTHALDFGGILNNGRGPHEEPAKFDRNGIEWGLRWFPTHIHFGPDNDTLLVGLCHVKRTSYCRIGKYSIAANRWEILPFEENRTYNNPVFSPGCKWIVYSGAACDKEARCPAADFKLYQPKGSETFDFLAN